MPPLPTLPITSPETLSKCRSLSVSKDRDIFIASYPKSGTTWMQAIVVRLLLVVANAGTCKELQRHHISQYAPFFEIDAHWQEGCQMLERFRQISDQELNGYRIYNTHLLWDMLPPQAKCIYMVRDGRDVLVSFYHHLSHQYPSEGGFEGSLDDFVQAFLQGNIAYGKWIHHLVSWMPRILMDTQPSTKTLLVKYQDLKRDTAQQVQRVAAFLQLPVTPQIIQQVVEQTSFEYMKEHSELFHPQSVQWKPGYQFIRKGQVGDHVHHLTREQQTRLERTIQQDVQSILGHQAKLPSWLYDIGFCDAKTSETHSTTE